MKFATFSQIDFTIYVILDTRRYKGHMICVCVRIFNDASREILLRKDRKGALIFTVCIITCSQISSLVLIFKSIFLIFETYLNKVSAFENMNSDSNCFAVQVELRIV